MMIQRRPETRPPAIPKSDSHVSPLFSPKSGSAPEMSFGEHLQELRVRLAKAAIAVAICAIGGYWFWEKILSWFTSYPLHLVERRPSLVYTAPAEAFMISFKIAVFTGIVAAAPFILYQAWCFISPGLHIKEKKAIVPVVFFSTFFFLLGVGFCYFVVLPLAFKFLLGFYTIQLIPMLTIETYIGFIIKMLVAFGLVFEMPVFTFVFVKLGLIDHRFLVRQIRYAVVIIFIIAAFLTPPDILSQTLMAIPMLALYLISIGVAFAARRRDA